MNNCIFIPRATTDVTNYRLQNIMTNKVLVEPNRSQGFYLGEGDNIFICHF